MLQGWLCPRCGKINHPALEQCLCVAELDTDFMLDALFDDWYDLLYTEDDDEEPAILYTIT